MSVFVWRELYSLTPDALYHPALLSPFVRTSTCSGRSKSRPPAVAGFPALQHHRSRIPFDFDKLSLRPCPHRPKQTRMNQNGLHYR